MANKRIKEYVQHSVTARKCKWKLHGDPASPSQTALTKSQRKNKCPTNEGDTRGEMAACTATVKMHRASSRNSRQTYHVISHTHCSCQS